MSDTTRTRLRLGARVAPLVVSLVIHVLLVGVALGVGLRPSRIQPPAILAELVVIEPAPAEVRPEPPRPHVEKRTAPPRVREAAAPAPTVAPRLLEAPPLPTPTPAVDPPPPPKTVAEEPKPAIVESPKPELPKFEAPKVDVPRPDVAAFIPTLRRAPESPAFHVPPAPAPSASSVASVERNAPAVTRTDPGVSFVGPADSSAASANPPAATALSAGAGSPGAAGASAAGANVAAIPGPGTGATRAAAPSGGYQVRPTYPASARRLGIQGTALLRVHVASDGRVTDVKVDQSAGHEDLDAAASEAVRRWRFEPGRRGDQPVAMWVLLPVEFRLK